MKKSLLIFQFFQKKDQLTVGNKEYQETISFLFQWFVDTDKITDDKTTKLFPNIKCQAKIIAKQEGVAAGLEEIKFLLEKYTNLGFRPIITDGSRIKKGTEIAQLMGKSHAILAYERTILNILQRMSGIATQTNRLTNLIHSSRQTSPKLKFMTNTRDRLYLSSIVDSLPYLAATRKTPWMSLDKKAVAVGGGLTHRLNLSDGILIKDNHLELISKAAKAPLKASDRQLIEIEVETPKQALQAIRTFQSLNTNNYLAIMFDNFTPSSVKTFLSDLSDSDRSQIIFEASGGITQENIQNWSKTGVDILSLGSLTHSAKTIDISLKLKILSFDKDFDKLSPRLRLEP